MAHSKNPLAKLFTLQEDMSRTLQVLVDKGKAEDLVEAVKEIQEQRLRSSVKASDLIPPVVLKIQKLLVEYPGFQSQTLETLNTSIKSAEKMGILEKFKAKPVKVVKKTVE